ncbi:MAG: toll/interleukin-1 receptor domain-containing protein, partial [Candidatus Eremiobacterota bacterium]
MPRVFISYVHESAEAKDQVRALADRLRADGVDAHLDQYEVPPPPSWPRWMMNQIETADHVLVVCSEAYARRLRGEEEAGRGLGSRWEGGMILQGLYEGERPDKYIPVVLRREDRPHIPIVMRSSQYYDVSRPDSYEALFRRITGQLASDRPELAPLRTGPR